MGVECDDDLVRPEQPQGIVQSLQRVRVADVAASLDAESSERGEAVVQSPRCRPAGTVVVRGPVAQAVDQRRGDDEHLVVAVPVANLEAVYLLGCEQEDQRRLGHL